jgi:hypothetical protein
LRQGSAGKRGHETIVGAAPIWHEFMQQALTGTPDQWYTMPAGLQGGRQLFPARAPRTSAAGLGWPVCHFGRYNAYGLSWADTLIDGVPCVLGGSRPAAPLVIPRPVQAPH